MCPSCYEKFPLSLIRLFNLIRSQLVTLYQDVTKLYAAQKELEQAMLSGDSS